MNKQQFYNQLKNPDDDPEIAEWWATTTGRHFAGIKVDDNPLSLFCECCGHPDYHEGNSIIATRRLNTSYVNDGSNWMTSCLSCFEERNEWYNEMWAEYYANCI